MISMGRVEVDMSFSQLGVSGFALDSVLLMLRCCLSGLGGLARTSCRPGLFLG